MTSPMPTWEAAPVSSFGELRYIQGRSVVRRFAKLPLTDSTRTDLLTEAALYGRNGWDVYYALNPRSTPDGHARSVTTCTALFVDLDGQAGPALAALAHCGLIPTGLVSSGHGIHAYLLLDHAIDAHVASGVAQQLCTRVGGDPVWSPAQMPRLPGTINWKKRGSPTPVSIVSWTDRRFSLGEIARRLQVLPVRLTSRRHQTPLEPPSEAAPISPLSLVNIELPERLRYRIDHYEAYDRSKTDAALAIWAARQDWDDARITQLLAAPPGSKILERARRFGIEAAHRYAASTIAWARGAAEVNRHGTAIAAVSA